MVLTLKPILLIVALAVTVAACGKAAKAPIESPVSMQRIAHAGGGYDGRTYTNSIDALNFNKDAYELFEIDLIFTADDEIVCLHDWGDSTKRQFGVELAEPPTLEEFERLVTLNANHQVCTLDTLIEWMEENPDKKIVTDVKDRNVEALALIARRFDRASERVVPQIYSPSEFGPTKALGYENIILTLYRYSGTNAEVVEAAREHRYYAVTMPRGRVEELAPMLVPLGLGTYVHTINNVEEYEKYRNLGISDIYTDWLPSR